MTIRKATCVWEGGSRNGKGSFKADSGAVGGIFSFGSRLESGVGTNPEELLAAAEACCFAMSLCTYLEKAGTPPSRLEVGATCITDKVGDQVKITNIKLSVRGTVPGLDAAGFQRLAIEVKETCPVSLALQGGLCIDVETKLA